MLNDIFNTNFTYDFFIKKISYKETNKNHKNKIDMKITLIQMIKNYNINNSHI